MLKEQQDGDKTEIPASLLEDETVTNEPKEEESELDRLAMEELLKEAKRGAERAKDMGAVGWLKSPVPPANKRFLNNTVMSAVRSNQPPTRKRSNEENGMTTMQHIQGRRDEAKSAENDRKGDYENDIEQSSKHAPHPHRDGSKRRHSHRHGVLETVHDSRGHRHDKSHRKSASKRRKKEKIGGADTSLKEHRHRKKSHKKSSKKDLNSKEIQKR